MWLYTASVVVVLLYPACVLATAAMLMVLSVINFRRARRYYWIDCDLRHQFCTVLIASMIWPQLLSAIIWRHCAGHHTLVTINGRNYYYRQGSFATLVNPLPTVFGDGVDPNLERYMNDQGIITPLLD